MMYQLHMATAKIVDDSIGEEDTVYDVLAAIGRKTYTARWYWGAYHRHPREGKTPKVSKDGDYVSGPATDRWVDAAKELRRQCERNS